MCLALMFGLYDLLANSVIERPVGFWGVIHDRSVIRVKPDPEVRILASSFMTD
jgi:hypothetical protein